jgi:hypothetical protein
MIIWFYSINVRMGQHTQIDKCNTAHKQNREQKSHDHLNTSEKAFDKIPYPFMRKALKKLGIKETYLNIIKSIFKKTIVSIIQNREN